MASNFESVVDSLKDEIFTTLYPTLASGDWTKRPLAEQQELSEVMAKLSKAVTKLRSMFDKTVWEGHENGSVSPEVKPVRAKGDYANGRPGRKAKTADEIFETI